MPPDSHRAAATLPTLTDVEAAGIKRANAAARRRTPTPYTARDDEIASLHAYAAGLWLAQPEIIERLGHATTLQGPERLHALDDLVADCDGLVPIMTLARLLDDWPQREPIHVGWSPALPMRAGRPGERGRTMTPAAVRLAVRSLALRPAARDQLNKERMSGYRGGAHHPQRGHEHSPLSRARGVDRADDLAAHETGAGTTAAQVARARERLRSLIA